MNNTAKRGMWLLAGWVACGLALAGCGKQSETPPPSSGEINLGAANTEEGQAQQETLSAAEPTPVSNFVRKKNAAKYGTWKGSRYDNDYYGLHLTLDEGWQVPSKGQEEQMNATISQKYNEDQADGALLLQATRGGSAADQWLQLSVKPYTEEDIPSLLAGSIAGLVQMAQGAGQSVLRHDDSAQQHKIDGYPFVADTVTVSVEQEERKQTVYMGRVREFLIIISAQTNGQDGEVAMQAALDHIELD